MRWVDLMYALPGLLVAIVVVGVLGGGYWLAVALLVVLSAPYDTRIVRGATLEQRSRPYVEAARMLGVSRSPDHGRATSGRTCCRSCVANTFLTFAFASSRSRRSPSSASASGPGTADWGRMLAESRTLLVRQPGGGARAGGDARPDRGEREPHRRLAATSGSPIGAGRGDRDGGPHRSPAGEPSRCSRSPASVSRAASVADAARSSPASTSPSAGARPSASSASPAAASR